MDYNKLKDQCIQWIRDWFERNGKGCRAVLGMSGGKDSTVAAALCVEALGKENVVGVAMPAEGQSLNGADEICEYLGIRYICAPIAGIIRGFDDVRAVAFPVLNHRLILDYRAKLDGVDAETTFTPGSAEPHSTRSAIVS